MEAHRTLLFQVFNLKIPLFVSKAKYCWLLRSVEVQFFIFIFWFLITTGLVDLAIKRNSLIGGDDFKSGQTKMKSVLVDFLVGAGIKVYNTLRKRNHRIFVLIVFSIIVVTLTGCL
jgi:hypothetical protein